MVIAVALVVPILIVPPVPMEAAPASRIKEPLVPVELVLPAKRVKLPLGLDEEVLFPGWIVKEVGLVPARVVISGA